MAATTVWFCGNVKITLGQEQNLVPSSFSPAKMEKVAVEDELVYSFGAEKNQKQKPQPCDASAGEGPLVFCSAAAATLPGCKHTHTCGLLTVVGCSSAPDSKHQRGAPDCSAAKLEKQVRHLKTELVLQTAPPLAGTCNCSGKTVENPLEKESMELIISKRQLGKHTRV